MPKGNLFSIPLNEELLLWPLMQVQLIFKKKEESWAIKHKYHIWKDSFTTALLSGM
jgi:hypothetical protein